MNGSEKIRRIWLNFSGTSHNVSPKRGLVTVSREQLISLLWLFFSWLVYYSSPDTYAKGKYHATTWQEGRGGPWTVDFPYRRTFLNPHFLGSSGVRYLSS